MARNKKIPTQPGAASVVYFSAMGRALCFRLGTVSHIYRLNTASSIRYFAAVDGYKGEIIKSH
jgi:hypothetical protein